MAAKPDMVTDLVVVEAVGHQPMQSMRRTDASAHPDFKLNLVSSAAYTPERG